MPPGTIRLPFGSIYLSTEGNKDSYYDLQIEGVGTKVLVAELAGNYSTIGIDGVAMAVNDIIRSGARPFLLSDAIHISKSSPGILREIVSGIAKGTAESGAVLASGETGDVAELLHSQLRVDSPPFDLMVSCLGRVRKDNIIDGQVSSGDCVIGIESSGIHSNGLTLARKVLLKRWGGEFDGDEKLQTLERSVLAELLEPTRIYVQAVLKALEKVKIKAAIHITGDGYSKFSRVISFQNKNGQGRGIEFALKGPSGIFSVIYESARKRKRQISLEEMYMTFNMGFGFALIVSEKETDTILDLLNKFYRAEKIGKVVDRSGIRIILPAEAKPLILNK